MLQRTDSNLEDSAPSVAVLRQRRNSREPNPRALLIPFGTAQAPAVIFKINFQLLLDKQVVKHNILLRHYIILNETMLLLIKFREN